MRGIDRLRRQDRQDLVAEMLVEPRLGVGVERLVAEDVHAGIASVGLQLRPDSCWLVISRSASAVIAASCWATVSPSVRELLDAHGLLALEAGDADHEEFVEIVARDRQEAQPLEQRMRGLQASSSTRRLNASQLSSRLK